MSLHSISGVGNFAARKGPTLDGASPVITLEHVPASAGTLEELLRQRYRRRLKRLERLSGTLACLVCIYLGAGFMG